MIDDLFSMEDETTAVLSIHAQPGAGRSEVVGRYGDALKVRVAAPPEHGRANEAIAKLLSERFAIPPSTVTLLSGASGRSKRFKLTGVEAALVRTVLERLTAGSGGVKDAPSRGRR